MSNLSSLATSAKPVKGGVSQLWTALVKKFPTIRNATQYYARDLHQLSTQMYSQASAAVSAVAGVEDSTDEKPSSGESRKADAGDAEVHYAPLPMSELGVTISDVGVAAASGDGSHLLQVCIEGGFAVFEIVREIPAGVAAGELGSVSVHEVCVDIHQHQQYGPATMLHCDSRSEYIVLMSSGIGHYFCTQDGSRKGYVDGRHRALSFEAKQFAVASEAVVVASSEFNQLSVLDKSHLSELRVIFADRLVMAVKHRWLAYCGTSERGTDALTQVVANQQETTMETVSRNVATGMDAIKRGLGLSPHVEPAATPLGNVVIADLQTGCEVACFAAHSCQMQFLAFDESGTLLATTSTEGLNTCVFRIEYGVNIGPNVKAGSSSAEPTARVTLLYRLARGMTSSTITCISFAPLNGWVAVCSSIGTCHLYKIPSAYREPDLASVAEDYQAPVLKAFCRIRSAPSDTPVNPCVVFGDILGHRPDGVTPLYVISSTATMVGCSLSDMGLKVIIQGHLGTFEGPQSACTNSHHCNGIEVEAASLGMDEAHCASDRVADSQWRSHVELRTHPACPKLRRFTLAE